MRRKDLWKLSLLNVFSSPVRSLLTVLGIAIGIGAVLAVLTLGDAGKAQVRAEMSRLGIDRIWLTASGDEALREGDGLLLAKAIQVQTTEQTYLMTEIRKGEKSCSAPVVGCSEEYVRLGGISVVEGRMLYPLEWSCESTGVLLGKQLAGRLSAGPGDELVIAGNVFSVRGIVEADGAFSRVNTSDAVFLPLEVLNRKNGLPVQEIMLSVPADTPLQTVADAAQQAMLKTRNLSVDVMTMQVQMEAADSVMTIFVDVLKWVAMICILVGGIGVMNILLVSVRERRREIGVMKSLGATGGQVCILFLLEALIYALVGGAMGILLGMALTDSAGRNIGLRAFVSLKDCVLAAMAAGMVGLVSGVWPAYRASCLNPGDALRSE